MARSYAQIQLRIWSDEDFKALDPITQHGFFVLISQPRMSLCGVLDYLPRRIATCSRAWSVEDVESVVKALEVDRYVVVDRETDELLVRSFIRNDGLLTMPNVAQGMSAEYGEVMSQNLRDTIEAELRKAYRQEPELKGWDGIKKGNPVLFERVTKGLK